MQEPERLETSARFVPSICREFLTSLFHVIDQYAPDCQSQYDDAWEDFKSQSSDTSLKYLNCDWGYCQ